MPQANQEIKIIDNLAGGEYANAMQVIHNKEEFCLSFYNITPPNGRVCAKVITNPAHLKRMILALQDNLKKYEENFGEVKEAESLEQNIGFKTN